MMKEKPIDSTALDRFPLEIGISDQDRISTNE